MASNTNAQLAKLAISIVSVAAIASITGRIASGQGESEPAGELLQPGDAGQVYTPAPAAAEGRIGLMPPREDRRPGHDDDDDEDDWDDDDWDDDWEEEDDWEEDDGDRQQLFLEPRSAVSDGSVPGGQGSITQPRRTRSKHS